MYRRIGLARKRGRALVVVGVIGLISVVAYFADIILDINMFVGLVERGATHPFLVGHDLRGIVDLESEPTPNGAEVGRVVSLTCDACLPIHTGQTNRP